MRRNNARERYICSRWATHNRSRVTPAGVLPSSEFPKGGANERWSLLSTDTPMSQTLRELLAATADRRPNRTALVHDGGQFTYRELLDAALRVAKGLDREGAGGAVVVRVDRTAASVIAILGTLLSGRTYVPIAAQAPRAHVDHAIRETGATVAIDRGHRIQQVVAHDADQLPRPAASPDVAYVLYTSGTSGVPKGCAVTHANVVSLLDATRDWFSRDEDIVSSVTHSLAFDFSVWELWAAFDVGGTAVLLGDSAVRRPQLLASTLEAAGVTMFSSTPTLLSLLLGEIERQPACLHRMRWLVVGGEPVRLTDMARLAPLARSAGTRMVNMYGITETTVHVTAREMFGDERPVRSGATPIGAPLPNAEISIRDETGATCPSGTTGEIWVCGAGVCEGYVGRPELTRARFVEDDHNRRWYRSGDLGLFDGSEYHHLGRLDRQVQLNGYRIELAGVEAALEQLPDVERASVHVETRRGGTNLPMLVAYVQATAGVRPDRMTLLDGARSVLPTYSIPSEWRLLAEFPLNANGKVDVRAVVESWHRRSDSE